MNGSSLVEAEAFLAVVDHGGFGAAARALKVTQSTISHRVAQLERRLGQRLLERTTRSMMMTPLGEKYAARLRDALALLHEAERVVTSESHVCEGPFRIAIPTQYGRARLVEHIVEISTTYPRLALAVELSDREVDLLGGDFDMALSFTAPRTSGIEVQRLAEERMIICGSPDLVGRQPVMAPSDLVDRRVIASIYHGQPAMLRPQIAGSTVPLELNPLIMVTDLEVRRELALRGCGIVVLPEYLAEQDIAANNLVEVLTDTPLPSTTIYLSWARHRRAVPAVRALRKFFEERLARLAPSQPSKEAVGA